MQTRRGILACVIGNALEWYEFSLFAYLSPIITQLFFPNDNHLVSLLATLLVFAAGFIIRPLGSVVLGHFGDQLGRARTLKLTILLMSISSVLTGFLPSYQSIGAFSPILLIACRLLQGFCIGGEFAGSMIYLTESANPKHRAFISSMSNNGSNLGVLIAMLGCWFMSSFLSMDTLASYGWRFLFISGGLLGIVGLWLRTDLVESETFFKLQSNIQGTYFPLKYVLTKQFTRLLHIIFLLFISACGSYTLMGYLSTYLHEFLHVPFSKAYQIQTLMIILSFIFVPFFAYLSDKTGRKNVLLFSTLGYLIFSLPCFYFLNIYPSCFTLLPLIICYAAEQAVTPVLIAEMFPGKGRYTGISIAYNISMATIGGFSPAINTALGMRFGHMMIAYYILFCAFVSFIIVLKYLPKQYGLDMNLTTAESI